MIVLKIIIMRIFADSLFVLELSLMVRVSLCNEHKRERVCIRPNFSGSR